MRPGNTLQLQDTPQSLENPATQTAPTPPASHKGTPPPKHSQESEASAEAPRASLRELIPTCPGTPA